MGRALLVWLVCLLAWPARPSVDACRDGAEAIGRRDFPAAEAALRECVKSPAAGLESYLLLSGVYQALGNSEALEIIAYQALKKFPEEKRFYLTAGTYAGRGRRFTRALEVLEAGFRRWPDDGRIKALLESALVGRGKELLDSGQDAAAEKHLRRAVELEPRDAEAYMNLGRALHNLHRGADALAAFDRVQALDPRFPLLRFHRGMTLHALGEFEKAAAELSGEIEANPGYAPAYFVRGLARMATGDWAQALGDLDAAVTREPADPKAQFARARCLARLGRTAEAEQALRKTIEMDDRDPAPLNALVRLLLQAGRREEAAPLAARAAQLARQQRSAAPGEVRYQRLPPMAR